MSAGNPTASETMRAPIARRQVTDLMVFTFQLGGLYWTSDQPGFPITLTLLVVTRLPHGLVADAQVGSQVTPYRVLVTPFLFVVQCSTGTACSTM